MRTAVTISLIFIMLLIFSGASWGHDDECPYELMKDCRGGIVYTETQRSPEAFKDVLLIRETYFNYNGDCNLEGSDRNFFCREIIRADGRYMKSIYRKNAMRQYSLSPDGKIEAREFDFASPGTSPESQGALLQSRRIFSMACEEFREKMSRFK
jgi:hypothetical protein